MDFSTSRQVSAENRPPPMDFSISKHVNTESRPPLTSRIRASFESRRNSNDNPAPNGLNGTNGTNGSAPVKRASSRPPITSRIRASLEGRRSYEVTSPTTPFSPVHDPEAMRLAVDQAINSEAFQNAIAANIAKIVKPSIKTALDTMQPVVEAVYAHDILLRKTNQNVDDILDRMNAQLSRPPPRSNELNAATVDAFKQLLDEQNSQIFWRISELSNSMEASNTKMAELAESVSSMQSGPLPSQVLLTTLSATREMMEQLKTDMLSIKKAIPTDLGANIGAINQQLASPDRTLLMKHSTKLDMLSMELAALNKRVASTDLLQSVAIDLAALRAKFQDSAAANSDSFATLIPQVNTVQAYVEAQSVALQDVKDKSMGPAIMAEVQKSNDSHAAHSEILSMLNVRSISSASESFATGPAMKSTIDAVSAGLTALKDDVQTGFATHHENVFGLNTKVEDVLTTLEAHRVADRSSEILSAVQKSNDFHVSHAASLESVKSTSTAPPPSQNGASNLEPQFNSILSTLQTHSAALDYLKNASASGKPMTPDSVAPRMNPFFRTPETRSSVSSKASEDVGAGLLSSLHDVKDALRNHATMLTEARETDGNKEILAVPSSPTPRYASALAALLKRDITQNTDVTSPSTSPVRGSPLDNFAGAISSMAGAPVNGTPPRVNGSPVKESRDAVIGGNQVTASKAAPEVYAPLTNNNAGSGAPQAANGSLPIEILTKTVEKSNGGFTTSSFTRSNGVDARNSSESLANSGLEKVEEEPATLAVKTEQDQDVPSLNATVEDEQEDPETDLASPDAAVPSSASAKKGNGKKNKKGKGKK